MRVTAMLIVVVTGGRDYSDTANVRRILDRLNPGLVVHGGAKGADTLADEWSKRTATPVLCISAPWSAEGLAAGPNRNARMMEWARRLRTLSDQHTLLCVAFPGDRGTRDAVNAAMSCDIPVLDLRGEPAEDPDMTDPTHETVVGRIGEMDKDNQTCRLRDLPQAGELRCSYGGELPDQVYAAFDSQRLVRAVLRYELPLPILVALRPVQDE